MQNALKPFSASCIQLMAETISNQFYDNGEVFKYLGRDTDPKSSFQNLQNYHGIDTKLTLEISKLMLPLGCIFLKKLVMITNNTTEALLVQAIKAIGKDRLDGATKRKIAKLMTDDEKAACMAEGKYMTTWVYEAFRDICLGEVVI